MAQQPLLCEQPEQHDRIDQDPDRCGDDVPEREDRRAVAAPDDRHDDAQLQHGREDVAPEEDRAGRPERGEERHEHRVERLERGEHDHDQEHGQRQRVVEEAGEQALERERADREREADRDDGQQDDRDRSPHPAVVAALLVDRREPADRSLHAEQADGRPDGHDRERQREGAVVGLREMADDQDLGDEIQAQPEHPTDQEQARAADLLDVRRAPFLRGGRGALIASDGIGDRFALESLQGLITRRHAPLRRRPHRPLGRPFTRRTGRPAAGSIRSGHDDTRRAWSTRAAVPLPRSLPERRPVARDDAPRQPGPCAILPAWTSR